MITRVRPERATELARRVNEEPSPGQSDAHRGGAAPWVSIRRRRPPLPALAILSRPCHAEPGEARKARGSGGFSFGTRTPGCRATSRRFTLGWVDLPLRGASGRIQLSMIDGYPGTAGFVGAFNLYKHLVQ